MSCAFSSASNQDNSILLPRELVQSACSAHRLLRILVVTGAGFARNGGGVFAVERQASEALFIYCVDGVGWAQTGGHLTPVSRGDLVVLPPATECGCGARGANPWSLHWVRAAGLQLQDFLQELRVCHQAPVRHVGDDPQLARLFGEIQRLLQNGVSYGRLLHASQALAYALAMLVQKQQETPVLNQDIVKCIAEAIVYLSEHLDQPLRVTALARIVSLSPAYFSAMFKRETGCAPRDYLHLLRIHRACQLLQTTTLSIKQVSARLGYQDQFHFSRQFKAFQGVSPTEYRDSSSPLYEQ